MSRPVTLFTGQWADLPFETVCAKAVSFGYDGLELACWGDHFEVDKATDEYCKGRREILDRHGLKVFSISTHLVGQAVADRIDERHKSILPHYIWGDGDPEGVRQRAAKEIIATGEAAKRLGVPAVATRPVMRYLQRPRSHPSQRVGIVVDGDEVFVCEQACRSRWIGIEHDRAVSHRRSSHHGVATQLTATQDSQGRRGHDRASGHDSGSTDDAAASRRSAR